MAEAASGHPSIQRRRSERISKSLPIIVRGIDLLGQPFEERTSTLTLNLHGCRYASKHHLPKNTWVTLEIPQGSERQHLRARVAWIQRPHSVREFFQIAVELESPANVWNLTTPPTDWAVSEAPTYPPAEPLREQEPQPPEAAIASAASANPPERFGPDMTNPELDSTPRVQPPDVVSAAESPLLRQWSAELDRQAALAADVAAARAVNHIRDVVEEFKQVEAGARENLAAQVASKHQEVLAELKAEGEHVFEQIRGLLQQLERGAEVLHVENEAAGEASSRLAQARLQIEAAEAVRVQAQVEASKEAPALTESDAAEWRQRLESEMALAQTQWNELLQSSLDSGVGRLVEQLSAQSQELLHGAEQRISERVAELRQPLGQMQSEARDTLSSVRSALEEELGRARSSLSQIEAIAARLKESSSQFAAANQDAINELRRRLESIVEEQSDEMGRRAERLLAGVPQRLAPTLDSLSQQAVERTASEVDSKLEPRLDRASELLRALASREADADQSVRLHRERLRQVGENHLREVGAHSAATLASLHADFESARKEALGKWSEELDASSVHASHAAAESIGRSSEWFQQEARARLQVQVEQSLASAANRFEEKAAEAVRRFDARLEEQSSARLAQIHERLDGAAAEITGRTQTQLERAAEAAAASFGEVLGNISEQEVGNFTASSRSALAERENELGRMSERFLQHLEANGQGSFDRFRSQIASHLDASIADGCNALAAEFTATAERYRAEHDAYQKNWAEELHRIGEDAVVKHHERLQTAGDSWVVSSVRRLNEHGQDAVDTLMRQADQNLRDSLAKFFEGLSGMLREHPASPATPVGFAPPPAQEMDAASAPHNESASGAKA